MLPQGADTRAFMEKPKKVNNKRLEVKMTSTGPFGGAIGGHSTGKLNRQHAASEFAE